jgi:hypothetical protein
VERKRIKREKRRKEFGSKPKSFKPIIPSPGPVGLD